MKINELYPPKIYVDLDGVLADFQHSFPRYDNDIKKLAAASPREIYDFYANLPMLADGEKLIAYLQVRGMPFTVLTAPLRPHDGDRRGTIASEKAKIEWVKQHLGPGMAKTAIVDPNKYRWATNHGTPNILIDDMSYNTGPWKQRGGIPILHQDYASTVAELDKIISGLSKNS